MDMLLEYVPLIIPFIVLQFILAVVSVIHVIKHPYYRFGNKTMWILIVCLVQFVGPVAYFAFGRGEEG